MLKEIIVHEDVEGAKKCKTTYAYDLDSVKKYLAELLLTRLDKFEITEYQAVVLRKISSGEDQYVMPRGELQASFGVSVAIYFDIKLDWKIQKGVVVDTPVEYRLGKLKAEISTSGTSRNLAETVALKSLLDKAIDIVGFAESVINSHQVIEYKELESDEKEG